MCGIAGIVSLDGRPIKNIHALMVAMGDKLDHRGPDSSGIYLSRDGLVGLFNNRLSIVGISDNITLPIKNRLNNKILAYNGEIFNHKSLRSELIKQGFSFSTNTDTEVMLCGLEKYGVDFLDKVDGFWSFAYYDSDRKELLLSRDLMGEKPLYYTVYENNLFFASEVSSILSILPKDAVQFNHESIVCSFQYRSTTPGRTLIESIFRVKPGGGIVLNAGRRKLNFINIQKFYLDKWVSFFNSNPSKEQVISAYEEVFFNSCLKRIPDEVDYISTLSGGIDSSLINVFINKSQKSKHDTLFGKSSLSDVSSNHELSELKVSINTSKKLQTNHHVIDLFDEESYSIFSEVASDCFDGVFCEGVASFRQLAHYLNESNKRVLILSDGPDEALCGYNVDLKAFKTYEFMGRKSRNYREGVLSKIHNNSYSRSNGNMLNWSYLVNNPFAVRPNHGGTLPSVMSTLFNNDIAQSSHKAYGTISREYLSMLPELDIMQRAALGYATTSLPEYVNTRSDRAIMGRSVESRLPFQAKELMELMIATPEKWRNNNGKSSKYILRLIVEKYLGNKIAFRSKYGFAEPAWKLDHIYKHLRVKEVIGDSSIFTNAPFNSGAKDFIINSGRSRYTWMAFSLASTINNFERNIKNIGVKYGN